MLLTAACAILLTMALALVRAILGPSVYDRVLAVNMFGTKTVLLIAVMAFAMGRQDFLDLALAYALINFIGVLAVLWFVQDSQRPQPLSREQSPPPPAATPAARAGAPEPAPASRPQLPAVRDEDKR